MSVLTMKGKHFVKQMNIHFNEPLARNFITLQRNYSYMELKII